MAVRPQREGPVWPGPPCRSSSRARGPAGPACRSRSGSAPRRSSWLRRRLVDLGEVNLPFHDEPDHPLWGGGEWGGSGGGGGEGGRGEGGGEGGCGRDARRMRGRAGRMRLAPAAPDGRGARDRHCTARPPGQHLLDELTWVHDAIRHDLAICRKLADDVAAGATQGQVDEQLRALRTNGPLWQLRVNCLTYCRHVHAHHGLEDALLFPALRRANPAWRAPSTSSKQTTGTSRICSTPSKRPRHGSGRPTARRAVRAGRCARGARGGAARAPGVRRGRHRPDAGPDDGLVAVTGPARSARGRARGTRPRGRGLIGALGALDALGAP